MNNKILEKLLKSIGKIVVKASTVNCCCLNCVPVLSNDADCAGAGGTFYQGSDCSEFAGNCCKTTLTATTIRPIRNNAISGRFVVLGSNTNILKIDGFENMRACPTQIGPPPSSVDSTPRVPVDRIPCCRKRASNGGCSVFVTNFPPIANPPEWRGRTGLHQCRSVRLQGAPDVPSSYIVVCTPLT